MSRLAGYAGSANVAGVAIAGIKKWTITQKYAALDTSGFDTGQPRAFIPGMSEVSGTFEGAKDGAPLTIGSVVALILKESATATQAFNGSAIVTELKPQTTVDGLVLYTYSFQGTGAWVIPTT